MKEPVSEQMIKRSSAMILRFALTSLIEIAMIEALAKGRYSDLVGLIDTNNTSDLDILLLQELEEPKFNLILDTVFMIHECIKKYLMIVNLDDDDIDNDPEVYEFSNQFFCPFYSLEQKEYDFWHTHWVYLNVLGVIDAVIHLNLENACDLDNQDAFCDFNDRYIHGVCENYAEITSSDVAVGLWYELFVDVEEKYEEITCYD